MKASTGTIELRRLENDSAPAVASMLLELEGRRHADSEADPRWATRFASAGSKEAPPRWPARFLASDTKTAQVRK